MNHCATLLFGLGSGIRLVNTILAFGIMGRNFDVKRQQYSMHGCKLKFRVVTLKFKQTSSYFADYKTISYSWELLITEDIMIIIMTED